MHAKRAFLLLGPGLVASLALSQGLTVTASAAPVQAATQSISDYAKEPPNPDPGRQYRAYSAGYQAGRAAFHGGKPASAAPVPSAQGHSTADLRYYQGWRRGWDSAATDESLAPDAVRGTVQQIVRQGEQQAEKQETEGIRIGPLHKERPELPAQGHESGSQQRGTTEGHESGSQQQGTTEGHAN